VEVRNLLLVVLDPLPEVSLSKIAIPHKVVASLNFAVVEALFEDQVYVGRGAQQTLYAFLRISHSHVPVECCYPIVLVQQLQRDAVSLEHQVAHLLLASLFIIRIVGIYQEKRIVVLLRVASHALDR